MTAKFNALRSVPKNPEFDANDALVIFGELFDRGYANGLVEASKKHEMKVFEGTVGRRDKEGQLRPLTPEEASTKSHSLINIPLEAGFDLYPDENGKTPCDQLQGVKLSQWQDIELDFKAIEEARKNARQDFRSRTRQFLNALSEQLGPEFSGRLVIAHTMAGGVPRSKIVMPLMNRVFKGTGDRYLSSETFWNSEIGRLCAMSFDEVTADTLEVLIEEASELSQSIKNRGGEVAFLAYGYHGTEVLTEGELRWQSYSPYLQGWSKKRLEDHAQKFSQKGVKVSVYNCPEILTNSSSIFQGVEVPLYPLLTLLDKQANKKGYLSELLAQCKSRLGASVGFEDILEVTDSFLTDPRVTEKCVFEKWPQHSSQAQLEFLLESSDKLREMHKDSKVLITEPLSEAVFLGTGRLMLSNAFVADSAVLWLGHDVIAKQLTEL